MLSKTRFDEIFHMSGRSPSHLLWFSRYHQITVNLANCSFIKKTDNFETRITFAMINIFGSGLKHCVGIDLLYISPSVSPPRSFLVYTIWHYLYFCKKVVTWPHHVTMTISEFVTYSITPTSTRPFIGVVDLLPIQCSSREIRLAKSVYITVLASTGGEKTQPNHIQTCDKRKEEII